MPPGFQEAYLRQQLDGS